MKEYKSELVRASLKIGALRLSVKKPFLWASGYYMPVYTDNRIFLSEAGYRGMIADAFISMMKSMEIKAEVIAGTATAGIPHAAALADKLSLPLTYVRSSSKDHGLGNRIEGLPAPHSGWNSGDRGFSGKRVVLIEDLVSTGGSSISALKAVREADGIIEHCLSIFSYGFPEAEAAFSSLSPVCTLSSVITYGDLVHGAENEGYITSSEAESLREWREDPFLWGKKNGFPRVKKGTAL